MTETAGLTFDVAALRQRYADERARRIRPDGIAQYVEIAGEFARFGEDPWVDGTFTREPLTDEVDVAIIGAGFGGLLTGARLRELGVDSVRLIDRAADVGGTWYWNRYPGIACDVESYVYIPLLEELGYIPAEKYAKGAEIFAHCRRIAEHYDLYRDACLQTDVQEIRWDATTSRWIIRTNRGDEMRAKFVSMANGYQAKPKLPGIAGLGSFQRPRLPHQPLGLRLHRRRSWRTLPISGSASSAPGRPRSSACRIWPRPPSTSTSSSAPRRRWTCAPIGPQIRSGPMHYSPAGSESVSRISRSSPRADRRAEDLVADAWTSITRKLPVMRHDSDGRWTLTTHRDIEIADFAKMEEIRGRVDEIVADSATAEALKPWYGYFCKRPCFHDEYLQTFNRDNVSLVDTRGRGVERITESGVVVDGVDLRARLPHLRNGFRGGHRLLPPHRVRVDRPRRRDSDRSWSDGVRTFHGLCANGFPNCFIESISQAGLTVNFPVLAGRAGHARRLDHRVGPRTRRE